MSGVLKKTFFGLCAIAVLIFVVGFFLPSSKHLERSVEIGAPAAKIFPYLNDLKQFNEWSPWARLDPDTQYSYSGPNSGVGAKVQWVSQKREVGSGGQEIIASTLNEYVKTQLSFGAGGPANAEFTLDEQGETTQVTWGFDTQFNGIVDRYFGLMLDKWVGGAYEEGLQNLKSLSQAQ